MPKDFNSYGARRGNHEVMVRGTLANIRLRNQMAPGTEGGWTQHLPDGEQMYIYDASCVPARGRAADDHRREGIRLGFFARLGGEGREVTGREAVIAESFERIHRTNLVGMGVLPLQFQSGDNAASLKLTGKEISRSPASAQRSKGIRSPRSRRLAQDGKVTDFDVTVRVDTPQEVEYFRHGGILPFVLRQLAGAAGVAA